MVPKDSPKEGNEMGPRAKGPLPVTLLSGFLVSCPRLIKVASLGMSDSAWPLADAKLEQELLDLVQSATRMLTPDPDFKAIFSVEF